MKKLLSTIIIFVVIFTTGALFAQTMTELVVPKYFGSKSAASTNNCRTPIAFCVKFDGLTPNTSYDMRIQLGLVSDAATVYGAGNIWAGGTVFSSSGNYVNAFMTDANGSSGPVWVFWQPTGNSSRFDAGQQHTIRASVVPNGTTMPTTAQFAGTKVLTALDIPTTARTAATDDDGYLIKGTALPVTSGKMVLLYDNVEGTGDPLFVYQFRQAVTSQLTQSDLPASINAIYMQDTSASVIGDYPGVVKVGTPIKRIEAREADNTIFAYSISETGIWGTTNTNTLGRREVGIIDVANAPVPVELVSFTANVIDGKVNLTWTTATETNNSRFEVERSSNGVDFAFVGSVKGNGTTTERNTYSFVDNSVNAGKYTYRLKQVDFDGSYEYSKSIEVNVGLPTEFSLSQNYPNPFNPSTTINFALPKTSNVKLTIYNALGKEVATLVNGVMEAGNHSAVWNAANNASGMYFFKLEAGNFTSTKKMMLIK
jgi:hypothetical protein